MPLYLSDSKLTSRTFYKSLLEQLGFEAKYYRGEAKRQLHKEIEIMKGVDGVSPVAIVDEAHTQQRNAGRNPILAEFLKSPKA